MLMCFIYLSTRCSIKNLHNETIFNKITNFNQKNIYKPNIYNIKSFKCYFIQLCVFLDISLQHAYPDEIQSHFFERLKIHTYHM